MKKSRAGLILVCWLAAIGCAAQAGSPAPQLPDNTASTLDLFAGYSYWAPHGIVNGSPFVADNEGMLFSGSIYFNRWLGIQIEGERHQQTVTEGMRAFSAGPALRLFASHGTAFSLHALLGEAGVTGPDQPRIGSSSFYDNPETWNLAATAGGSMDYVMPGFHGHFRLRLFQADYQYMRANFGPAMPTQGGHVNIRAERLSTGIVYSFGNRSRHR